MKNLIIDGSYDYTVYFGEEFEIDFNNTND